MNEMENNNGSGGSGYSSFTPNSYNGPVTVSNAIPEKNGGIAVASLVFGIISLVGFWSVVPSLIFGIVAIIMGIVSLAKKNPSKGMAIAGIIIGVLGTLLSIAMIIIVIAAASVGAGMY